MIEFLTFIVGGGIIFLIGASIFFSLYSLKGSFDFIFKKDYPEISKPKTPLIAKKAKSKAAIISEFGDDYKLPEFYWSE